VSAKKVYKVLVIGAGKRGKHTPRPSKIIRASNSPDFPMSARSSWPRPPLSSVSGKPRCNLSLSPKKSNRACSVLHASGNPTGPDQNRYRLRRKADRLRNTHGPFHKRGHRNFASSSTTLALRPLCLTSTATISTIRRSRNLSKAAPWAASIPSMPTRLAGSYIFSLTCWNTCAGTTAMRPPNG
jgi:hypothetical protein